MSSVLFKNALIVTMNQNRDVLQDDLLVQDGFIKCIGPVDASVDQIIDAGGRVLIPGLIQTHVHLCQTLFRGQADDLELLDWLNLRILPLEAAHDYESLYCSTLLGIGELFRGGTTSIVSMETIRHTEAVFQAITESGIRAVSGKCMMDRGEGVPGNMKEKTSDSLQESVDLLEKWHGAAGGRLHYAFCPRFAVSCSEELLVQVRDLARRYRVKMHTHASENLKEVALIQAERKMRNVAYLERLGLTGADLILAHCVWLDREEMEMLCRSGTNVAHCPSSNLKLGSGIAPVPAMLDRGVQVSIGADGAPCNNNLDVFTEMRIAALIQKPRHGAAAMPAGKVFALATLGGARAMSLDKEIGSLEVGKKADIVMVNLNNFHCLPAEGTDIYGRLVYQARASDVALTMVDGRIVYENGYLTTIDEEMIAREAGQAIKRVRRRAGMG